MKTMVTYMSNTGNTKKIAEAILEGIDTEKTLVPIDQVESLDGYDLTFMGFPIKQMGPDKKTAQLIKKHCVEGRNVVLFITHAAPEGAPDLQPMLDKFSALASEANVIDMFDCQGELAKGVKMIMSVMPNKDLRRWAKEDNSKGQPDATRVQRAKSFAAGVMKQFLVAAK